MMKLSLNFFLFVAISYFFTACNVEPVAIDYNEDQCHACKMTISDSRFGAELVTKKGKVYKFDAAECMVRELNKEGEELYEFVLVTDFNQPKKLLDARTATYLISKKLSSPMGANLSAYATESAVKAAYVVQGGGIYSWDQLKIQGQLTN